MRIAVIGGGISGLVAAFRLRQRLGDSVDIVVLEQSGRVGGVLRTGELAGEPVDLGAEAFVGRRPEVIELMSELGLDDQLVRPAGKRALIWAQAAAHPLPGRTLMGIPSDAESLRGLVDDATLDQVAAEAQRALHWTPGSDVDVHTLVGDRFGRQVVERSVDPLLGGVYAGISASIGIRAALPTLAKALDEGASSLTEAVRTAMPAPSSAPVFGGLRDGYAALLAALTAASGARLVTTLSATRVASAPGGWVVDPLGAVDAVVIATPAPVAARLLHYVAPEAARAAAGIELSSSALVAMALPRDTDLPDNSGILVATGEPLHAKAFTLSSRKWPHLAERDVALVRASFGRLGDDKPLSWTDADLVAAAVADLTTVTGVPITPLEAVVQRWPGGLPQYAPGHCDLISTLESAIAPLDGIAVAGAYLHGVGVPACVASGTAAAERIATHLG
ncbi:MAG: protoporphyrinogen oxidase [Nocardia sp.]|nr:protoporphyrinogen oxidase [Nocardia sp.]